MKTVVALICCAVGGAAIFAPDALQQKGSLSDYQPGDWLDTPWTKTAPELDKIKAKAEALGKKGTASAKELVSLARAAKASYHRAATAENLFRWATYAYEAGRWSVDKYFGDKRENYPTDTEFGRHGSAYADVYVYARARFFREVAIGPGLAEFDLGRRLLAKNDDDLDVKLAIMRTSAVWSENSEAFGRKIANEAVRAGPSDPMTLFSAGKCYWSFWFTKRRKEDWEKGIALNEKFISLAPPDLNSVKIAKRLVTMMKEKGYKKGA